MTDFSQLTHDSPPAVKIACFRSLFQGREDVFARRFESRKSGKSGYQPACANEWVRGVCEKPRVKCAVCPQRSFLPITDRVIHPHLSGRDDAGADFVMGLYPMLSDESCWLLVADFDKTGWREDVTAFRETCRALDLPVALERSRSGNGGHLLLFFAVPLPSALARRLASYLLTETMEHRPDLGLDSYDRLIPNQDTMPQGGLGNLIALPLQKQAREQGNSVFLDEALDPYPDQWAYLSSIRKIGRSRAEEIVARAEARGRVLGVRAAPVGEDDDAPWLVPPSRRPREPPLGDLPERLDLTLGDQLYLAREQLTPGLRNRLLRLAAFQNPEFYKAQAMRLPTFGKPRIIACAEEYPLHLGLPRGCLDEVTDLLQGLKIRVDLHDQRCSGTPLPLIFGESCIPNN